MGGKARDRGRPELDGGVVIRTPFMLLYANAAGLTVRELSAALGSGWSQTTVRYHMRAWLAGGYVRKVGTRLTLTTRGVIVCTAGVRLMGWIPRVLRAA